MTQQRAYVHKPELSKAYDRVDWKYIKQMIQKMSFIHKWIDWIMTWITTVRYTMKLNGTLFDSFELLRGLWQGHPLSPYFDGLSSLIERGISLGNVSPIKVCRRPRGISHLLFADDTCFLKQIKLKQDK